MTNPGPDPLDGLRQAIASRVHHELRTPLTVATMACELLRENGAGSERCVELIVRALSQLRERMSRLDLLEAPEPCPPAVSTLELEPVVVRALEELRPLAEDRGVSLLLTSPGRPIRLRGDEPLVGLAVRELADNAVRFNRRGGRVRISLACRAGTVRLRLADDGVGLRPSDVALALRGFHQAEPFLTRREPGMGIGLAVARRIVEAHGGRLRALSRAGRGTCMTALLPEAAP
ncbi:MAG: HAMP domain-containing histidine kinase [Elusimicrobia bacterium]|nr:HAMP domain-containing histidine kinase [Elusimicrobiota bacterium]